MKNSYLYDFQFSKVELDVFEKIKRCAETHRVTARIAGGYVRDKILDIDSHDIDIAIEGMSGAAFAKELGIRTSIVEARPEQSKHLETAIGYINGMAIDFCGLRKETYTDSRIPTIETGTPQEDATRRDLTINALFYNLHNGEVEDYCGGVQDLRDRVARTPMDAKQTFLDDPLRILRCIRFAAKYGLKIDDEILFAANDVEVQDAFLNKISKERIFAEVFGTDEPNDGFKTGFLTGPNPPVAMGYVKSFGFMDILFSPIDVTLNDWNTDQNNPNHDLSILDHTLTAVSFLNFVTLRRFDLSPQEKGILNLALICHDLGKRDPACIQVKEGGSFSYLTHEVRSIELARIVLEQMSCPNKVKERVLLIVEHHMRFHALQDDSKDKALRKILRDTGDDWFLLLLHSEADSCGKMAVNTIKMINRHEEFRVRIEKLLTEQGSTKVQRPINGHDLAELGIPKGPAMGVIFGYLDEQLLECPDMSRERALELCKNWWEHIE